MPRVGDSREMLAIGCAILYIYTNIHTHTHTHILSHNCNQACIHARTSTYTHIHAHTHKQTIFRIFTQTKQGHAKTKAKKKTKANTRKTKQRFHTRTLGMWSEMKHALSSREAHSHGWKSPDGLQQTLEIDGVSFGTCFISWKTKLTDSCTIYFSVSLRVCI